MTIKVSDVASYLETIAPLSLQESYDNSGLIVGNENAEVKGILISLDCTEDVIDEAILLNCNLVVAHHPIIFKGLKKLNGSNYIEKTVIKAIQHNISIYAIHTNLDNVLQNGVNNKIAELLKLKNTSILQPKSDTLLKLVTYVPKSHIQNIEQAVFIAGAGHIGNYSECAFTITGYGSFKGNEASNPFVGNVGERHYEEEIRFETIFPAWLQKKVVSALLKSHPYEEVAYDIYALKNDNKYAGSGIIGILPEPKTKEEFLKEIKQILELKVIRYTLCNKTHIQNVAVCGGSGSFLLPKAISSEADAFITADFKYHEFFDAENKLMICDIGHFESEKFTKELLNEIILKKFSTFAVILSKTNTNPVNYYY